MDSLVVSSNLTVDDWRAYQAATAARFNREFPRFRAARVVAVVVIATLACLALLQMAGMRVHTGSLLVGALFMLAVQVVVLRLQRASATPESGGAFLGAVDFTFCAQGVRAERPGVTSELQWQRVHEISLDADHLFVWLDRLQALVVPLKDLAAVIPVAEAQRHFSSWIDAARQQGSARTPVPASAAAEVAQGTASPVLAAPAPGWPASLLRWWTLRASGAAPAGGVTATLALLSLASLAVWSYLDWRVSVPDPEFSPYAIPLFGWYALGTVVLAAALRWRSYPAPRFDHMLVVALGLAPFLFAFIALPDGDAAGKWVLAADMALGCAMTVYLSRAMRSITGRSQRFAVLNAMLFVVGFCLLSNYLNAVPSFWSVADTPAAEAAADTRTEEVLFEQSARIDEALASVSAGTGNEPKAYFLGFAGVGEQRVFAEEVGLARRVLGEKYHIDSRSVSLINDQRDLDRAPLATVSGLRYALRGLAGRMNTDRDVLFLAISSHGSQDRAVAVSNSAMPLNDLTDDDLADALRESGIRWRVLIISACYAGGFIDALKDPHTIVITAAAQDRTSFGCSNDRDLTYFGEAFYRDALPAASSLRAAFDAARIGIDKRERAIHEKPSNPQAYFGRELETKIEAIARRDR